MDINNLEQELKSLGMPVAYLTFKNKTLPPFITYLFTNDSDVKADNQNYAEISNYQIELYTSKKDKEKERLIQEKLKELELSYSKSETYITSEKMHQVVYSIQLI
ncbi:hypothetical protein HYG86_09130 [Alkalicella caledoniensis]|uniref:Prophage pi2 protein 38 n=1 Tax=Alkalicella caledoniensis TaxID=2731377 RepID=A0A7G9W8B2_ALKCA|nr:hypothetical protein [Alkalicella caledoniensis]QNO14924.1 hypothetical protein HYG86_09130 [Alkalicella caledoniensis]